MKLEASWGFLESPPYGDAIYEQCVRDGDTNTSSIAATFFYRGS